MDPDLCKRTPADWPDVRHETTDQMGQSDDDELPHRFRSSDADASSGLGRLAIDDSPVPAVLRTGRRAWADLPSPWAISLRYSAAELQLTVLAAWRCP